MMRRVSAHVVLVVGVAALVSACSTDALPPANMPDAATLEDARDTPDAAPTTDASGTTPDASVPDASVPDASVPDASVPDASVPDASVPDAGEPDAGEPDAGDAGEPDVGEPEPDGETCETAIDATGGGSFVGDTTGADDDYAARPSAANCPSGSVSGSDHVYRLAPATTTSYGLRVEPAATFDPFIYVKDDCSIDACIDGTVLNGIGVPENLSVTVPAGAEYFVIVDGELLSEGAYTLIVTIE